MKKNLNEQVSRIKSIMGLNESSDMDMNQEEIPYETQDFKVGDTVSDPSQLGTGPEFDGKILAIFPNLESGKGQPGYDSIVDWIQRYPEYAEGHDINGKWYLINWRTEGEGFYSEKDMKEVIIAPDDRNFDDYEEDEYDGRIHTDYSPGVRSKWDWKDRDGESY